MPEPRPEAPQPCEEQPDDECRERNQPANVARSASPSLRPSASKGSRLGVDRVALACDDLALLDMDADVPDGRRCLASKIGAVEELPTISGAMSAAARTARRR